MGGSCHPLQPALGGVLFGWEGAVVGSPLGPPGLQRTWRGGLEVFGGQRRVWVCGLEDTTPSWSWLWRWSPAVGGAVASGCKLCAPPGLAQALASLRWGGPEGRSPPPPGAPDPDWQGLCSGCSTCELEGTGHCAGPAGSWRQGRPPLGSSCCRLVRPVLPDRGKLGRAVRVQPRGPCLHGIKGGAGPSGQWEEEEHGYFPGPLPGSGWALGWCQGQEHLAVAWLCEDASGQARGAKGPPGRVGITVQESGWSLACCTQRRTRVVRGETSAGSVQPGSRSLPSSSWWEGLLRAVPSDQP